MFPSSSGASNRHSWNPPDTMMRPSWGGEDRQMYRGRDDQSLPQAHHMEDRNLLPPTMLHPHPGPQMQPGESMYPHAVLPPPSEMWPVGREQIHPVQPAPRQRTAIACRYCRRRKIRCSGFDSSADGRCTNCLRFNQECVFTPVSSQAQAFVPAHTQYPHLKQGFIPPRGGPARPIGQLYGSYGQPLPLNALQPHSNPSEHGHQGYGRPPSPGYQPLYSRPYDDPAYDRERSRRDDRPPSLPQPLGSANYPHSLLQRRGSAGDYSPSVWRGHHANPPASPPPTLPPPRQFSPPLQRSNNNYTNGIYPPSNQPSQTHSQYPHAEYDRQYYPGPGAHRDVQPHSVPQRRSSDPNDRDGHKEHRYPSENSAFAYHPPTSSTRTPPAPVQSPPRSSSAGPQATPSHPMQLSNLIDPNPPPRSDADARMLKSLTWKP